MDKIVWQRAFYIPKEYNCLDQFLEKINHINLVDNDLCRFESKYIFDAGKDYYHVVVCEYGAETNNSFQEKEIKNFAIMLRDDPFLY